MKALKYIWQLPQNLVALIYYLWLRCRKEIVGVQKYKDYILYRKKTKGSVTLGQYVFASKTASSKVIQHETGHVKQSLLLGPLYLIIIGIPSLIWAMTYKKVFHCDDYYAFFPERWANELAGISFTMVL